MRYLGSPKDCLGIVTHSGAFFQQGAGAAPANFQNQIIRGYYE